MNSANNTENRDNSRKLISVVIPTFNEEDNVERAYIAVKDVFDKQLSHYDFEIVFTDNHSTDNTLLKLEKIASKDKRVRVASFTRNFGFNRSLITGYRLARGDAAIQLDCDLQDPPELAPKFIELWEQGHDVVVGIREKRDETMWLQGLRKAFYRFLSNISQDNLIIDGGDFRLVDKHILDSLRQLHDATPYVRGLVSTFSRNQTGFSYQRQRREFGESKFPLLKLVGLAVDGIVSHSTAPLRLASMIGFLIVCLTLILASAYFVGRIFFQVDMPAGFATSVILELFSISINAIFLGIIGEYLSRIHQQLRQHPTTVIQKAFNLSEELKDSSGE